MQLVSIAPCVHCPQPFPVLQEESGSTFSNVPPSIPGMDEGACARGCASTGRLGELPT